MHGHGASVGANSRSSDGDHRQGNSIACLIRVKGLEGNQDMSPAMFVPLHERVRAGKVNASVGKMELEVVQLLERRFW